MSSRYQSPNYLNNILSCGYIREHEIENKILIPHPIQNIVAAYSKQYNLYAIGRDINSLNQHDQFQAMNTLICNTKDVFVNGYGMNIKSKSNQLYICDNNFNHLNLIPDCNSTINIASSGIANNTDLFLYTVNHRLYKSTIQNTFKPVHSEFVQLDICCIKKSDTIISIKCGTKHALILTKLGNVYSIGVNDVCQCGLDNTLFPYLSSPQLIMENITAIACGSFHSLFINNQQQLLSCGYNYSGVDTSTDTGYVLESTVSESEEFSDDDSLLNSDLLCAPFAFLTDSDSDSDFGIEYGINKPVINKYFVDLNIKIGTIYAGKFHSMCIGLNGECYTFGFNEVLCEWENNNEIPKKINGLDMEFIDGSCGENHNLLLTKLNDIVAFGDNRNNQCSIVNTNEIIKDPFVIDKEKELGLHCFIEKVICLKNESLIFVDVYKR